jgi:serine/threonine-protein kinase
MPDYDLESTQAEDRIEQVLAELLREEENGTPFDLARAVQSYPDLETPLREFFRDRAGFDRLAPCLGPTAPRPAAPDLPTGARVDGYEIIQEVDRGGRGIVYRVRDAELARTLAVKVLRPELRDDADAVRRFLEERQVTAQLQHPGIVPVHAVGTLPDGRPYFAMKLVQGRTLAALLAERLGTTSPQRKQASDAVGLEDSTHPTAPAHADLPHFLNIFEQICQAVAFAHSRGVIHRDLKPKNVMVGAFAEVQVMDWGLAKVLAEASAGGRRRPSDDADTIHTPRSEGTGVSSSAGTVAGTYAYMSPEQAKGRKDRIDERADVFGLGAVLCEILTGLPPYSGASGWELHMRAEAGDLADAFEQLERCGADAELIALAKDCLAVERERRPRDAGAAAQRLAGYLAGVQERLHKAELEQAAAVARATEAQAKIRAERRARRLMLGLAAAVLVVIGSLASGGLWLQRQRATLRQNVETLLSQSDSVRRNGRFEESLMLIQQAQDQLGEAGPDDLREKVSQALLDTALARRLDIARKRSLTGVGGRIDFRVVGGRIYFRAAERAYEDALKDAGLGQEGDDPEEMAARIRSSAVRDELLAAIDDWAGYAFEDSRREWLLAVARAVDPDPANDRFRRLELRRDPKALARLVDEIRPGEISPQLMSALGRAMHTRGVDPIPLLRKVQARHPNDYWLNVSLGGMLHRAKQWDEAIGFYRAALALQPDPAAYTVLGNVLHDKGSTEEAIFYHRLALVPDSKYVPALVNLGISLCATEQWDEGFSRLMEALRIEPDNASAHYNLGVSMDARGRPDDAINEYKKALEVDALLAEAHDGLGKSFFTKGMQNEAIHHYRKALEIDPKFTNAYSNLGEALYAKGEKDEALRLWNEALRLDPKNAMVHNNLGTAAIDEGRLAEAIDLLNESVRLLNESPLRLQPKSGLPYCNLGNAYKAKGNLEKAIVEYERALQIDPKYSPAHHNLANTLTALGRADEAIAHLEAAIALQPTNLEAHISFGLNLSYRGLLEKALDQYKETIQRASNPELDAAAPTLARAYGASVHTLLELGRFAEARGTGIRCLKLPGLKGNERAEMVQRLQGCEHIISLESRLAGIVSGSEKAANRVECLNFAELCRATKNYAAAVRWYTDAFAVEPNRPVQNSFRYRDEAACCASQAAAGLGKDLKNPDDSAQSQLRRQALAWLRVNLDSIAQGEPTLTTIDRRDAIRSIWGMQAHVALSGVRDKEELEKLNDTERQDWMKFWADAAALRKHLIEGR